MACFGGVLVVFQWRVKHRFSSVSCINFGSVVPRPDVQWTMSIPLKRGSQIKIGAFAKRRDMESFATMVQQRSIGRVRALTSEDENNAREAQGFLVGFGFLSCGSGAHVRGLHRFGWSKPSCGVQAACFCFGAG